MQPTDEVDLVVETLKRAIAFWKEIEQPNNEFRAAMAAAGVGMASPAPAAAGSGLFLAGCVHGATDGPLGASLTMRRARPSRRARRAAVALHTEGAHGWPTRGRARRGARVGPRKGGAWRRGVRLLVHILGNFLCFCRRIQPPLARPYPFILFIPSCNPFDAHSPCLHLSLQQGCYDRAQQGSCSAASRMDARQAVRQPSKAVPQASTTTAPPPGCVPPPKASSSTMDRSHPRRGISGSS